MSSPAEGSVAAGPVDVVCVVLRNAEGQVFAARRPNGKRLGGLWEFPGGKVESGESCEEALHREIQEELGISLTLEEAFAPTVHQYAFGSVRLIPFGGKLKSGEIHLKEHSEFRWLSLEDLFSVEWVSADVPVVNALLR